jgi:hypothetical protein
MKSERPVRDWFDEHPATSVYVTVAVTIILILRIIDSLSAFF